MPDSLDPRRLTSYSWNAEWAQSHRPECVSAIGLLLLTWNRAEEQLAWTIAGVMGITLVGDEGISFSSDWIMSTVMSETGTVHGRIKIVDAILKEALKGHSLDADWKSLRLRMRQLADQRNTVVHTRWAWSEQQPNYLLQIEKSEVFGWNEGHLLSLIRDVKNLEDDLHRLMLKIANELRVGTLVSPYLTPRQIPASN